MSTISILDGGMGRQLKAMGAPFKQPEWSALALMEAPEFVSKAHSQFIDAGANIITTNNYAVVPFHIGDDRFAARATELIELSANLAREQADAAGAKVAGSLPPLYGSYRPDLFQANGALDMYKTIVSGLAGKVDFWLAETISSLEEAAAIRLALEGQSEPLWVSFTLSDDVVMEQRVEQGVEGRAVLRSEESIRDMLEAMTASAGKAVDGVLFNCSQPEIITLALAELNDVITAKDLQLVSGGYGNAFTPRGKKASANSDIALMRDEITPEHYADIAGEWIAAGATVIGGCCGIGPEHIAQLSTRYS